MFNKKQAQKLLTSYNNKVAWGKQVDQGAALQEAIDFVFHFRSEEQRADLYARLMEGWPQYKAGTSRELFVSSTLQKWDYDILQEGKRRG